MNGITLLITLIAINSCCAFYMIARPGGIFKLRNDMNHGLHYYPDRNKKALFLNDPSYHENLYNNHDYGLVPPMMMDYSMDDGNGQGSLKVSIPAISANNDMKNNGKNIQPIDFTREMFFI